MHLCESTLAFGKAEEPAPRLTVFNLLDIVQDVIDSERLSTGEYDLSFSEDIPTGMAVRGDTEQLYRVISNLVRNARQAIINSGKPGEINIAATESPACWIIRVTDTGPGLPAKAKDHLFQPFQGGTTRGGTGLGLSIAMELVRGHGGELRLERTDETGTTFTVELPKGDMLTAA